MASLNTFGAIMTYAIDLEDKLHTYYQALGDEERAAEAAKRRSNLERVRRENVLEITLEAISGLDEADYSFDFDDQSADGQAALERVAAQFYSDVAPKINVRQAQRVLKRYAGQHQALADGE